MIPKELEWTEEFLDKLINDSDTFNEFLLDISLKLKGSRTLSFPIIEKAIKEVYGKNDAVPPETDTIHYVFNNFLYSKPSSISNTELSALLKQLQIEYRNLLYHE